MPHATPLISTIVAGLVLAFIFGAIAHRLRLPPLVGYLLAGVLVGPHTPGYVADQHLAPELAEIGVILLMFGVGLHFSLKDLMSVRGIAIPGAIVQIAAATGLGCGLAWLLGWSLGGGLVFGLALSVASTVVLLKALQDRRLLDSERGKIAVGWLIVEDLAMVLALVLIPALAGSPDQAPEPLAAAVSEALGVKIGMAGVVALTLLKVAVFVGLMLVVGRRLIPAVLHRIAHSGSRELFRLGVLAIALGVAFGSSALFGVSLALGAFFAGMVLAESELSHRAAQESLPLRDAFAVLFFVSVGMLFDPSIILRDPWSVAAVVFIILIGKSIAAFLIVLAFRGSVSSALTISASLAQIGEFSFILAELGVGLKLLPEAGRDLILGGALISIVLNPLAFFAAERFRPRIETFIGRRQPKTATVEAAAPAAAPASPLEAAVAPAAQTRSESSTPELSGDEGTPHPTALTDHVVLVGFGRVGGAVGAELAATGARFLVIEDSEKPLTELRERGVETIVGNGADPAVLALTNLPQAQALVVAIPEAFEAGQTVEQARALNPSLKIIARAHSDAEVEHLMKLGADEVVMGEREIAHGMVRFLAIRPAAGPAGTAPAVAPGPAVDQAPPETAPSAA